jgi:hypothetical protein
VRTLILVAVTVLVAVSCAACSDDGPAAAPKVPAFTTSSSAPAPQGDRTVPKTCGGLATLTEVVDILGVAVTGQTLPVVGVPEAKIGRTARLDCYYGVPDGRGTADAPVWIGLASYTDEAAAKKRMTSTIDTERETGAKASDVPVGADRGVLLIGAKRTLVAMRGKNTVVVTAIPDLVGEDQAGSLLGKLADRALTAR